jgi:hypothetical protein
MPRWARSCRDPVVSDGPEESTYRDLDWDLVVTTKGPRYAALPTDESRSIGSELRALSEDKNMSVAPGHHLLPHERWFASLIMERQRTHRTPDILRMEQNYGPEGITLWAATWITVFPGMLMVVSGIVFMLASGGGGTLLTVAHWLEGFGVILFLLGSIRLVQGVRAGRAFRDGRPFLKRRSLWGVPH